MESLISSRSGKWHTKSNCKIFDWENNLKSNKDLRVLGFGDIDEDLSSRMNNIEELHDGSTIVGNGYRSFIVVNEFVHPSWPERGSNHISNSRASVDVAY